MSFTIRLPQYNPSMCGLLGSVTKKVGEYRVRKADSDVTHDVTVIEDDNAVTLLLQESDLYIVGFRNENGTFRFKDHPGGDSTTSLGIGSSYTQANCISILADHSGRTQAQERGYQDLYYAIEGLARHKGTEVDSGVKSQMGIMIFLISESLRFKTIFHRMCRVANKSGGTFSFGEFKPLVTNWQKLSKGKLDVAGAVPSELSTYHSIPEA